MKLILAAEHAGENDDYVSAAQQAGWDVVCETLPGRLPGALAEVDADAVILVADSVSDEVLQTVHLLNDTRPLPVVLFTEDSLQQSIRAAVSAGVSVYVVDCRDISRIGTLLDIAVARFAESQHLKRELHKAKTSLAERNTVEKAKGIIMRQRKINEDAAYRMLRKLAMDRNRRIGEVAKEIIFAAEVLI